MYFTFSGCDDNIWLRGLQPLSHIAFWFWCILPIRPFPCIIHNGNYVGTLLIHVKQSHPILNLFDVNFFLYSLQNILKHPFCSPESPTCHKEFPLGTPMHTAHLCCDIFMYSKKDAPNLELCPSNSRNGVGLLCSRGKTPMSSAYHITRDTGGAYSPCLHATLNEEFLASFVPIIFLAGVVAHLIN